MRNTIGDFLSFKGTLVKHAYSRVGLELKLIAFCLLSQVPKYSSFKPADFVVRENVVKSGKIN